MNKLVDATCTPLSSIFGSGFLVIVPVLASRAFAFYYLLQCIVAITVSRSSIRRAGIALLAALLGFITVFAVPAG